MQATRGPPDDYFELINQSNQTIIQCSQITGFTDCLFDLVDGLSELNEWVAESFGAGRTQPLMDVTPLL